MAQNYLGIIKKLQTAINLNGDKITVSRQQFYSKDKQRTVNMYTIKQAYYDEDKEHMMYTELFASASLIQVVLFLRDYWYKMNNIEIPHDNPVWEEAKRKYAQKHEGGLLNGQT